MRPVIKMLTGNYLTLKEKSFESGGSSLCKLCDLSESESVEHLISRCTKITEVRNDITKKITKLCQDSHININLEHFSNSQLTQFILDPSSLNLKKRVNISHPIVVFIRTLLKGSMYIEGQMILPLLFKLSRDLCYSIDSHRRKLLL